MLLVKSVIENKQSKNRCLQLRFNNGILNYGCMGQIMKPENKVNLTPVIPLRPLTFSVTFDRLIGLF